MSYLVVALSCRDPLAPPALIPLEGVRDVAVGRGDRFSVARAGDGRALSVRFADEWLSARHCRLTGAAGRWTAADEGSKNGTFVNGRPADGRALADRDVVEVGGVFFVFCAGPSTDLGRGGTGGARPPALASCCADLRGQLDALDRVARAITPVLVTGTSGVGKELTAHAIHDRSGRTGQLVTLRCDAIPADRIGRELFGRRRSGLLDCARGGTLLLDEVAALPVAFQEMLVPALLSADAPRRGAARAGPPPRADLPALVRSGRFRRDVYAWLAGFSLALPPLAQRREDIGAIAASLLRRITRERAPRVRLTREAGRAIAHYDYPFNIRELEHALRSALAAAAGGWIGFAHLPPAMRAAAAKPSHSA